MKILITGGTGQLGTDLTSLLNQEHDVISCSRKELDVTNQDETLAYIEKAIPDVIIHTGAYTKVDQAETEQEEAYRVNALGTRNIAMASERMGAKLVYLSTDYVFDGVSSRPYQEHDLPNPLSVYGKTKLAGEKFVQCLCSRFFILRTSWIYGKHGSNFVKTMLKLASERNEVCVVNDQIGSPTYTEDLSLFISRIIHTEYYGIYHVSNIGYCSWYDFAIAIFELAGIEHIKVTPVSTAEFPRPAPRPAYSVLDHLGIRAQGLEDLPHWRDALSRYFARTRSHIF
jgi:dTDP-4-dehydrorhamnose reductase